MSKVNTHIKHRFAWLLATGALLLLDLTSAWAQVKVACIGDSITAGYTLANPGAQSYPAQLQTVLGSGYTVQNYGDSGRTLMKGSGYSFWDSWAFTSSTSSSPDIVVIMLGTNDTKSWNWNATNFATDYHDLIATYQGLATHPMVYICLPPPVYASNTYGFVPDFVQNTLIPVIRAVAVSNGVTLIDNNTPLLNHSELFTDGVHPTAQGAVVITSTVAGALKGLSNEQTLLDIGAAAPDPGINDISQLSTSGNQTSPDGLNYYTDNNSPAGQTFTTGTNAMKLVSVAIKTAGLNSGGGYGTPTSTPTYYLRIYSVSSGTATLLITFSAPNPGFSDGDWLQWSGLNVSLAANQTYAFTFGRKPSGGGYAALAVATNAYAGGEIVLSSTSGGTVTTGNSHSFDAVFDLGLQPAAASIPASMPLPVPTYGWNLGNTMESTWGVPYPTAEPFYTAANAGFNAVRIPCAWDYNSDPTTHQINSTFMAQVKQVVDWAIAAGMYVVINDHWDDGWLENNIGTTVDPTINAKVNAYWTQIATAFAGYDNHLLFAAANEPNVGSPAAMDTLMVYYQTFVNAVRGVGGNNTNRWLVLQGGGDTSWLNSLPTDSTSNRLMVEYHCYSPSLFCIFNTDQSWGDAIYFWGAAYHYSGDPTRNASAPEEGAIDAGFQQLTDQYASKGIPVMVGEFGAIGKSLTGTEAAYSSASVYYWTKYIVDSAHAHGLSPFYWSTPGSPFDWNTGAVNDSQAVSVLTGGVAPPPPNGAPYAASGLTATATNNQVSLSWTAGSGATSYNLYRAAESGYESFIAPVATGLTNPSYTDTNLNNGTTYYYQVVAVNSSGSSGFSPEAHATTTGVNPDPAQFNFETDSQGWDASGSQLAGVATATAQHFAGNQSLAVIFNGTDAGTSSVTVGDVAGTVGTTITFHVWIPSGSQVTSIQPYLQDYNWAWTSGYYGSLTSNAWNTITLTVPQTATAPLKLLGLQFSTAAAWSGTCYIDSISWNALSPPSAPTGLAAVVGDGKVTLTWSASSTANNYFVKRSTTSGSGYATISTDTSLSFTDTGLVNGTPYYYVVAASNANGVSSNSVEVSATPSEMRARYAFEGNAQDSSGNGFHGTAGALTYVAGKVGAQAAQFNGSSSYVSIPRSVTDDFTVAMWVKTTDTTGTAGDQWWSGKGLVDGEVPGGGSDWGTSIVNGKFVLGVGAWNGDVTLASSVNINDGAWHHVAATRNNTNGAMQVYVDGVLRGSGTGPTGSRTYPASLCIGSLLPGYNFLNGTLDDVRLYDRILTLAEIAAIVGTLPSAPTGISATQTSVNQATVSWLPSATANSYNVKRYGASGGPYTTITTNVTATSYLDSGLSVGTPYYYVVSGLNTAGEGPNSSEAGVTLLSSSTVTITSVAAQDGYVRASSNANTTGGTAYPAANPSRLGDDNSNRQYKAFLSFDTSSIPKNAIILSGTLRLKRSGLTGTNPFTNHGTCYADFKGGTGFNGSTNLETADFQAAADATQVATMSNPANNGDWSSGSLNAAGVALIDKAAAAQYRIYFSTATDGNGVNDYISWYAGEDATSNRPALALTCVLEQPGATPKAWLRFDEGSGTVAADSSGHGWHGTLVNGPTWVAGKVNNAMSLSGSAYATLPTGVVSTLSDFTISAWVNVTSTANWLRIFDFGTGTGDYMYLTPKNGSNGKVRYAIIPSGAGGEQQIDGPAALATGTWTHVAVTLSGSTGILYLNGVASGTNTAMSFKPSSLGNTTQNYLGKSQFSGDPYLNGAIDEFQIYNRALNAGEISVLAAGQLATPQNVTATSGSSQIALSWSAVTGATGYTIQCSASSGGAYSNLATGISGTTCVNTGLASGATWYYTVAAQGLPGTGPASAPVSATTYTAVQNWRLANFGTINNSGNAADSADPDGDGWTNAQEYISGTNPNSRSSSLRISQMQASGNDMLVSFPTVVGKTYRVERSDTLQTGSWTAVQYNIGGTGGTLQVIDSGGAAQPRRFYRLIVTQ